MEKVLNVANYMFKEYQSMSGGQVIDEMKLHKLLYLTQRESFAVNGKPMFEDSFEGWRYGPVCRTVRNSYSPDGIIAFGFDPISDENAFIVRNVLQQYGGYTSWKLSEMSHKELSWKRARTGIPADQNGSRELLLEDIQKDAEKVRPYDSTWDMYIDEFEDAEAKD